VTDLVPGDPFLTQRETATRLHVSASTVGRLLNEDALSFFRKRRQRKPYASQINYVVQAIEAGRTGSIAEIADEWRRARQHAATTEAAV
jgi:transposase InsO family protein